ncbi:alpha/beta hydrolase [Phlyctema vagabunda]|uniref:Alpha/beta hydrolase n=1 Tax=Phlyctema vagabunda TaxID=108571 RepID=A0ABR4PAT7_9HELO
MHKIFKSTFFNFEFLRILSMTPFGGAEIAECLAAAGQIKDLDPVTWNQAWQKQAEKAERIADEASVHGDTVSARKGFMRAANYFRAAGYMLDGRPDSPAREQMLAYSERAVADFRKGAALLPGEVFSLEIPYDTHTGVRLPGYLYMPPASARLPGKVPVLISIGGADSIQEEMYFINSLAPDSGYALLTFEAPGQGMVLRRHHLTMRPDFEVVIDKVLDFLTAFASSHPDLDLDLDRIALAGSSMGGYFALRGAADPRVKACVAADAFYDMWDFATHHTSPWLLGLWQDGWLSTGFINWLLWFGCLLTFQLRWELALTQWIFGVASSADALLEMKRYSLRAGNLEKVRCPVLVSSATQSLYLEPSVDAQHILRDLVHLPDAHKRLWVANEPEDGGLQAKVGAFGLYAQRTLQFLDEHFGIERDMLELEVSHGFVDVKSL